MVCDGTDGCDSMPICPFFLEQEASKIWVSETSLADLFLTFARLVSVKVENQFLRLVSQG